VNIALAGTIGIHILTVPAVTHQLLRHVHVTHQLQDLVGWPGYGHWLGEQSAIFQAPVMTNRHEDAGEAAFYMPGQPEVWCVSIGTRPTAFDYFDEQPDFAKIPRVVWVGGNSDLFMRQYGYVEVATVKYISATGPNPRIYKAFFLSRP
jgi:hypothetical protein